MNTFSDMIHPRAIHPILLSLSMLAAGTGCTQEASNGAAAAPEMELEQVTQGAVENDAPRVEPFATIRLDAGRRVEFIHLGDGDIGIGEVGPTGSVSLVGALSREWNATPLEIYLALAGDGEPAPRRVVDAHAAQVARTGRAAAPARKLPVTQYLTPTGVESEPNCGLWLGTSWNWVVGWNNTYEDIREVSAAAFYQALDLVPGRSFYAGSGKVTAANMGMCVDHLWNTPGFTKSDDVKFQVYSKTSGSASSCGPSAWGSPIYEVVVSEFQSANFYTSSFAGKLVCATVTAVVYPAYPDTVTRDIGLGMAYTKVLDIGF